ncbi:TATA-box-binding protein [Aphanomyces cochlioides]|nr:TATA-box-binding protein [Aphanomyces cochlioides]
MEVDTEDDLKQALKEQAREALRDYKIAVVNIVATFDLTTKIDLKDLVLKARNVEYNPKRFHGAVMRHREPKATTIIFASGKVVAVGLKEEAELERVAQKVESIVRKIGFEEATARWITIQNITATGCAPHKVRLEGLLQGHARFCSFEPELFPALYYRMLEPKMCFMVFVSGKVVVCGAKTIEDIWEGFEKLQPVLLQFKLRDRRIDI